jgi:nitrogen fixation protein NifZ
LKENTMSEVETPGTPLPGLTLREAKYHWGEEIHAAVDLFNDGSLPDVEEGKLLIAAGGPGEIVQVGHHDETNQPIYMVDFGLVVLGCFEEEITRTWDAAARQAAQTAREALMQAAGEE